MQHFYQTLTLICALGLLKKYWIRNLKFRVLQTDGSVELHHHSPDPPGVGERARADLHVEPVHELRTEDLRDEFGP